MILPPGFFPPAVPDVPDALSDVTSEALRVSESRYRRLFETAQDGILLLNANTAQIEDVNPYLIKMLGYSHAEFLGKKLWEVGPFADIAQSKEMFEQLQTVGFVRYEDLPLKTISGAQIAVEFVSNSYDCEGIKVIQCNIRDISDRKAADAKIQIRGRELAQSNAELEQFAYVASHDLREPLRMVNSFLALLERRNPQLDAESREFLEFAKEGAVRMDRLVHDLLDISCVSRIASAFAPVDSHAAVAEAIANLDVLITESGAVVAFSDSLPVVMGNQVELVRLFLNLIGNAIKYRHAGRRAEVRVDCQPGNGSWNFSVADNGIGIDREFYDRIFMIFQRLHPRGQYEGTGIGLAICKKIVERHGGTIWVESLPDQGATFYFSLPRGTAQFAPTVPVMTGIE